MLSCEGVLITAMMLHFPCPSQIMSNQSVSLIGTYMEQGVLDTIYLVLRHPGEGFREVTKGRPLAWALLLYVIVAVVLRTTLLLGTSSRKTGVFGSTGVADVFWWMVVALIGLLVAAAILHSVAKMLKGSGSYSGLVCALAFAALPIAFFAPLTLF